MAMRLTRRKLTNFVPFALRHNALLTPLSPPCLEPLAMQLCKAQLLTGIVRSERAQQQHGGRWRLSVN